MKKKIKNTKEIIEVVRFSELTEEQKHSVLAYDVFQLELAASEKELNQEEAFDLISNFADAEGYLFAKDYCDETDVYVDGNNADKELISIYEYGSVVIDIEIEENQTINTQTKLKESKMENFKWFTDVDDCPIFERCLFLLGNNRVVVAEMSGRMNRLDVETPDGEKKYSVFEKDKQYYIETEKGAVEIKGYFLFKDLGDNYEE